MSERVKCGVLKVAWHGMGWIGSRVKFKERNIYTKNIKDWPRMLVYNTKLNVHFQSSIVEESRDTCKPENNNTL